MKNEVFADRFSQSFSSPGDFLGFLGERARNSSWMTASSKDLSFEAMDRLPTPEDVTAPFGISSSDAVLLDTLENTSLLLKVNGLRYPVRSCALKSVLERARVSGHALSKVSKDVFAEILNLCMGVASGDSLIRIADEKVSAVHGGDPKDYAVMDMLSLFQHVCDFLDREFTGHQFITAHFEHAMATAIWRLDGQSDELLDTYRREVAAKGLTSSRIVPALRFTTSDVGMSGANLYPIFLHGNGDRIIPLGYPVKTDHRNGVDLDYFDSQLGLLYARFRDAVQAQTKLLAIELRYPSTVMMGVLKKIGAPKKASYEALDYFLATHGDTPCTAHELYTHMSDVIFSAQCDGATGARIAQLEEIVARALHVNWSDYDRPGEFRW